MAANDDSFGFSLSGPVEMAEAAMGMADAHMVTMIAMMRVISRGLTGEMAYQKIAADLSAEITQGFMPGKRGDAKKMQLMMLASVFEQKPRST